MKKTITRICAIVLSMIVVAGSSISAFAERGSYTYNYDFWGDVQDGPDFYSVSAVLAYGDMGLDKNLSNPSGLYIHDNYIYICDTGNNRIVVLERLSNEKIRVVDYIDKIKGTDVKELLGPTDIAISEEGNIFIADQGNSRIVKVDENLNFICQFLKPDDNTLDKDLVFKPNKIVVDSAERVYCIATGINKGLVKYEADTTFSGFVGATPAIYNFYDYIWKKFASQEQRALLENFVPTEYDNIYMDKEGFIYTVTASGDDADFKNGSIDAVRKLNLLGSDILIRNGDYDIYGDLYMGTGGGHTGHSEFSDITVLDNDIYIACDRNRGRLFAYNDQGHLVFAMGGNGNMDGYFRRLVGIEHIGHDLLVLDNLDCAITIFTPTTYGELVYDAIEQFDNGNYTASGKSWEQVMELNGNYDLAYIGIGRALLRTKKYHEAMEYFELKYDDENYSKAYKQYRKEWVEEHIFVIVVVILALFLIPLSIGKIRSIKRDIDTADIFTL